MLNVNLKLIASSLLACAVAAGCSNASKKNTTTTTTQGGGIPAMNQAALDPAPAPPAAPPATFTPAAPPQPVVYDAPAAGEQPISPDALADASDYSAPTSSARPRRTMARSTGKRYTVRKGESLWSIAEAKYGNGNRWKSIAAANPNLNPDRVQAGQTIVLP
ncbi:MAG: resuscitation-promoting factor RpfA [Phycisphaerales bacterium]|jgi:5'-nucleotidase|nr:resuscitation-promoting factor RpfA [Phycisphaerales bacterium]MEA2734192.1 resuscitation-promoting factor RpfA [Humisphaera sp.]